MNSKKICAAILAAALSVSAVSVTACLKVTTLEAAAAAAGDAQSDTYAITKGTEGSGGSFVIDKTEAAEGETVTVTATHGQNFAAKIVVKAADNTAVTVTPDSDNPSVSFPVGSDPVGEVTSKFTLTMPAQEVTVTGEFTQYYPITNKTNDANGTITIDKPVAAYDDTLTITVSPNEGYELYELTAKGQRPDGTNDKVWTAEDVVDGKITTTMPRDTWTFTAEFKKTGYFHISSSAMISGKSQSPWAKLNVGETAGKGDAKEGDTVTLTVSDNYLRLKSLKVTNENDQTSISLTPTIDAPVDFVGENTTKTFTFTMPAADVLIEAEAVQIQPIEKSNTTNGTISLDKEFAETGDTVTITVTPDEGYELDEINVKRGTTSCELETVAAGTTYTFVVPGPGRYTVDATFKKTGYFHISSSAVISGKSQSPWAKLNVGETAGEGDAKEGDTVTLTVSDNYLRLKSLKVTNKNDQTSISLTPAIDAPVDFVGENTTKTFTFTMPAADVLIEAEAVQIQPIEKSNTTNGTISLDKEFAETGDTVTITVTPDEGYELDEINVKKGATSCELETVTAGTTYTFVVPGPGRYTVAATFKEIGSESDGNTTTPDDNDDNTTTTPPSTSAPNDNDDNTTTTPPSTSTVAPVEVAKVDAEVKAGETATVKAEGLGDVTVTVDKDDANLAGAKVEFSATNTEKTVKDNIDKAVGTDATEETKAMATAVVEAVKKGDAIALDIGFTKDGKDVQPGKDVTVTVPLPAALKDALKVYVYHVSDKGIEDVTEKCSVKDGKLTIKNDKFSPYIVSKAEIKTAAAPATSEPTTTNNPNTGVAGFVMPIVIAAGALTAVTVSKKRK